MLSLNEITKTIDNLTKEIEAKKQILTNLKKIQKSLEVLESLGLGKQKQKTRRAKTEKEKKPRVSQKAKASTGGISKELEDNINQMVKKITEGTSKVDKVIEKFIE